MTTEPRDWDAEAWHLLREWSGLEPRTTDASPRQILARLLRIEAACKEVVEDYEAHLGASRAARLHANTNPLIEAAREALKEAP